MFQKRDFEILFSAEIMPGEKSPGCPELTISFLNLAMSSEIAERTSQMLLEILSSKINNKGLKTSNMYSPGYCGWPLSDQLTLLSLVEASRIGITLTGSNMMEPVKSISGIIGVGKNIEKQAHQCDICNLVTCNYNL